MLDSMWSTMPRFGQFSRKKDKATLVYECTATKAAEGCSSWHARTEGAGVV